MKDLQYLQMLLSERMLVIRSMSYSNDCIHESKRVIRKLNLRIMKYCKQHRYNSAF